MSAINANALSYSGIVNQRLPCEGPKALAVKLDFSGSVKTYILDMLMLQQQYVLSLIQTLFIDMSGASNDMTVTINGSNQTIKAKAGTQGYYAVLCPNPPKLTFSVAANGDIDTVYLINVPVTGSVWTA